MVLGKALGVVENEVGDLGVVTKEEVLEDFQVNLAVA